MVKVSKIAVWEVEGELFRDVKAATARAREVAISELFHTERPEFNEIVRWMADSWDKIEQQVERAMAST